jgi:hypothetical protein
MRRWPFFELRNERFFASDSGAVLSPADGLQTLFSIEQKRCDRSMKR